MSVALNSCVNLSFDDCGTAHSADLKEKFKVSTRKSSDGTYGDSGTDGAFSEKDMERLACPLCGGVGVGAAGSGPDATTIGWTCDSESRSDPLLSCSSRGGLVMLLVIIGWTVPVGMMGTAGGIGTICGCIIIIGC